MAKQTNPLTNSTEIISISDTAQRIYIRVSVGARAREKERERGRVCVYNCVVCARNKPANQLRKLKTHREFH